MKDRVPPAVEGKQDLMLFSGNSTAKRLVRFTVPGVNAIITDHLEMLFRDMLGQPGYEVEHRNCFSDEVFIFMPVIMKRDKVTIIRINA